MNKENNKKEFVFFCMTYKGYETLNYILSKEKIRRYIRYVISEEEKGVQKDYYEDIKSLCEKYKIEFVYKNKFDYSYLKKDNVFSFCIGWKWIIREASNLIVIHDSILPKYRGFVPLVNMLINNESKIGVTAIKASEEMDKGPIIMQKEVNITYPIKIAEALKLIAPIYSQIVEEIICKIINDIPFDLLEQDEKQASYSMWRDELDYFIDFQWDALKIKRFIDAVGFPYKGSCCYMNEKLVRILDAYVVEDVAIEDRESHVGKVIFFRNGNPVVVCGRRLICFTDIIDASNGEKIEGIPFKTRFTRFKRG